MKKLVFLLVLLLNGIALAYQTFDSNEWTKVYDDLIIGKNPYHYLDQAVSKDRFEYRLEAVAGDESIILTLESGTSTAATETQSKAFTYDLRILPNPTVNTTSLVITLSKSSSANLTIYDLSGRRVKEIDLSALSVGENSYNLDVSNLSKGLYILQLSSYDGIITKRLLVNR